jgi:hypothetical protein
MYWVGFGLHAEWERVVGHLSADTCASPALLPLHTLPVREWDVVAAVLCRFPFPLSSAARACERGRCVPLFLATLSCPRPRFFVPRAAGWGPVVSLVAALAAPWSLAPTFVRRPEVQQVSETAM